MSTLSLPDPQSFSSGGLSLPSAVGGPAAPKKKTRAKKSRQRSAVSDPQHLLDQPGLSAGDKALIRKGLAIQSDIAAKTKGRASAGLPDLSANYHPDPMLDAGNEILSKGATKALTPHGADLASAITGIPMGIIGAGEAAYGDVNDTLHGRPTLKRTGALGEAVGKGVASDFRHPLRHPVFTAADLWGGAGGLTKLGTKGALIRSAAKGTAARDAGEAIRNLTGPDNKAFAALHNHHKGAPMEVDPQTLRSIVTPSPRLVDAMNHHPHLSAARDSIIKEMAPQIKEQMPGVWKQPRPRNAGDVRRDVRRAVFSPAISPMRSVEAAAPGGLFNETFHPPVSRNPIVAAVQHEADKRGWSPRQVAKEQRQLKRINGYLDPTPPVVKPKGKLFEGGKVDVGRIADAVNSPFRAALLYLKPAYAWNLAQNVATAGFQQGVHLPKNLWDALKLGDQIGPENTQKILSLVHEGATRSLDIQQGPMQGGIHKAANFWNSFTDKIPRVSSFLHEARREGFNTPEKMDMLLNDPNLRDHMVNIARTANKEIIDYGDLNKFEREWMRRIAFFYPWTKAAVQYSLRFPIEHPTQAAAYLQLGADAHQKKLDWLQGKHLPSWMETYMNVGHGDHPWMMNSMNLNTFYTVPQLAQGVVGLAQGGDPHAAELAGQLGPFSGSLYTLFSGQDTLGRPIPSPRGGSKTERFLKSRVGAVGKNLLTMVPPVAAYERANRESGVKQGGPRAALQAWIGGATLGGPVDLAKAEASGESEYVGTLSAMKKIDYKNHRDISTIPQNAEKLKAVGLDLPDQFLGQVRHDYELLIVRDQYIEKAAQHYGVTPRKMTADQRLTTTINFLVDHHLEDPHMLDQIKSQMPALSDAAKKTINHALLQSTGIGSAVSRWKAILKAGTEAGGK